MNKLDQRNALLEQNLLVYRGDLLCLQLVQAIISYLVVQSESWVQLFATPWAATLPCQASLSFTVSWSLLKLMSMSQWHHPNISSSVAPFSFCRQSFPASGMTAIAFTSSACFQSFLQFINKAVWPLTPSSQSLVSIHAGLHAFSQMCQMFSSLRDFASAVSSPHISISLSSLLPSNLCSDDSPKVFWNHPVYSSNPLSQPSPHAQPASFPP